MEYGAASFLYPAVRMPVNLVESWLCLEQSEISSVRLCNMCVSMSTRPKTKERRVILPSKPPLIYKTVCLSHMKKIHEFYVRLTLSISFCLGSTKSRMMLRCDCSNPSSSEIELLATSVCIHIERRRCQRYGNSTFRCCRIMSIAWRVVNFWM